MAPTHGTSPKFKIKKQMGKKLHNLILTNQLVGYWVTISPYWSISNPQKHKHALTHIHTHTHTSSLSFNFNSLCHFIHTSIQHSTPDSVYQGSYWITIVFIAPLVWCKRINILLAYKKSHLQNTVFPSPSSLPRQLCL